MEDVQKAFSLDAQTTSAASFEQRLYSTRFLQMSRLCTLSLQLNHGVEETHSAQLDLQCHSVGHSF